MKEITLIKTPEVTTVTKVTKTRFKQQFYDLMVELAADEETLVQIEGIEIMTEYLSCIKKQMVENDYVP